jgi:hypothetical protein
VIQLAALPKRRQLDPGRHPVGTPGREDHPVAGHLDDIGLDDGIERRDLIDEDLEGERGLARGRGTRLGEGRE